VVSKLEVHLGEPLDDLQHAIRPIHRAGQRLGGFEVGEREVGAASRFCQLAVPE
jgi:hypothetical protein